MSTNFSMDPSFLESIGIDPNSLSGPSTSLSGVDLSALGDLGLTNLGSMDLSALNKDLSNLGNIDTSNLILGGSENAGGTLLNQSALSNLPTTGLTPTDQASGVALSSTGLLGSTGNAQGTGSQWQTVGDTKIMIADDGSAIGINNQTGASFQLDANQVNQMIQAGVLDSKQSGYVAATGGTGNIPGGGLMSTSASGVTTVVMPDGKVYTLNSDGSLTLTNQTVDPNTYVPPKGSTLYTSTSGTSATTGDSSTSNTGNPGGNDSTSNTSNLSSLLPLLAAAGLLGSKGGGGSSSAGSSSIIPKLTASRPAVNYTAPAAGEKNVTYFSPVTYAAEGGQMHGGISTLGSYSDGGHLLKGPGDGVSDSIPATIGGHQPARLADGEFVIPARIVSELGNGSTDAGARKLYAMMDRIKKTRSQAKNIAADTKAEKHLPA